MDTAIPMHALAARAILDSIGRGDLAALEAELARSEARAPVSPESGDAEREELLAAVAADLRCAIRRTSGGSLADLQGAEAHLGLLRHLAHPALPAPRGRS